MKKLYTFITILTLISFHTQKASALEIGPVVQVFGFPTVFRLGVETKFLGAFGASASYGIFPEIKLGSAHVSANSILIDGKFYPFLGSFFLGLGFGTQNIQAKENVTVLGVQREIKAEITSGVMTPKIGWRWSILKFFIGMEIGVQIPISVSTKVEHGFTVPITDTADFQKAESEIVDTGNKIGKTAIPAIGLIQVGFLF